MKLCSLATCLKKLNIFNSQLILKICCRYSVPATYKIYLKSKSIQQVIIQILLSSSRLDSVTMSLRVKYKSEKPTIHWLLQSPFEKLENCQLQNQEHKSAWVDR
jgi:hypothetical protein